MSSIYSVILKLFTIRNVGIFCPGKEIKALRGGVPLYAAQANTKIDVARAKKHPFRTETGITRRWRHERPDISVLT